MKENWRSNGSVLRARRHWPATQVIRVSQDWCCDRVAPTVNEIAGKFILQRTARWAPAHKRQIRLSCSVLRPVATISTFSSSMDAFDLSYPLLCAGRYAVESDQVEQTIFTPGPLMPFGTVSARRSIPRRITMVIPGLFTAFSALTIFSSHRMSFYLFAELPISTRKLSDWPLSGHGPWLAKGIFSCLSGPDGRLSDVVDSDWYPTGSVISTEDSWKMFLRLPQLQHSLSSNTRKAAFPRAKTSEYHEMLQRRPTLRITRWQHHPMAEKLLFRWYWTTYRRYSAFSLNLPTGSSPRFF